MLNIKIKNYLSASYWQYIYKDSSMRIYGFILSIDIFRRTLSKYSRHNWTVSRCNYRENKLVFDFFAFDLKQYAVGQTIFSILI
ncbi:hypothetical protein BpHYR1_049802 [Brachionus plicatilis]|uniref:Uncharacterized protein n=1 Tax=Brachionus plicatilis TaxID=10195 RepID=A0A3M7RKZ4_BRAPC|nr:hypothetical protein BpHYR1_049802 [Brachionus plicatilis]